MPPAPPLEAPRKIDWNVFRSSIRLIKGTLQIRRLFLAIVSISFFWTIGAVLFIQFPPLVKNVLTADKAVASVFLAIFSIGVAIGSVAVNRLLKGEVSARYSPVAVILMGAFVVAFYYLSKTWEHAPEIMRNGQLEQTYYDVGDFLNHAGALWLGLSLLGIAIFGGIFVVPLYAFLTTTVKKSEAARTVAANNIVNAGCMTLGALATMGITYAGVERGGPAAHGRRHVPHRRLAGLGAAQGLRAPAGKSRRRHAGLGRGRRAAGGRHGALNARAA